MIWVRTVSGKTELRNLYKTGKILLYNKYSMHELTVTLKISWNPEGLVSHELHTNIDVEYLDVTQKQIITVLTVFMISVIKIFLSFPVDCTLNVIYTKCYIDDVKLSMRCEMKCHIWLDNYFVLNGIRIRVRRWYLRILRNVNYTTDILRLTLFLANVSDKISYENCFHT